MTGDIVEKNKMVMADLSDIQVAGKVRMLMRSDLDHEMVCTGARDRIMYLSQRVKNLESHLQAALPHIECRSNDQCTLISSIGVLLGNTPDCN